MSNSALGVEELRERLAALDPDLSHARAKRLADGVFAIIATALAEHRPVTLPGFGAWRIEQAAPRTGIGPDGRPFATPARPVVRFSAAKQLAQRIAA